MADLHTKAEIERVTHTVYKAIDKAVAQVANSCFSGSDSCDDTQCQCREVCKVAAEAAIAALRVDPNPRDAVVEALRIFLNDRSQVAQLEEALAAHDLIQPPDPIYVIMLRAQALLDADDVPYAIRRLEEALTNLNCVQEPKG